LNSQIKDHKHSVEIISKDLELTSQYQKELKKLQVRINSINSEINRLEEITGPKRAKLEELNKQYEVLIPLERSIHELETLLKQKNNEKEDYYKRLATEYGGKF
jgi:predicted  nucleic acid-binding Zn-ribbon protein